MCPIYIHQLHYQRALKPRTVWYQSRCNMAICMHVYRLSTGRVGVWEFPACQSGEVSVGAYKSINVVVVETPQATSNQLTHLIIRHADNGNLQGKCQFDVKLGSVWLGQEKLASGPDVHCLNFCPGQKTINMPLLGHSKQFLKSFQGVM